MIGRIEELRKEVQSTFISFIDALQKYHAHAQLVASHAGFEQGGIVFPLWDTETDKEWWIEDLKIIEIMKRKDELMAKFGKEYGIGMIDEMFEKINQQREAWEKPIIADAEIKESEKFPI
jgi:hypothetical protein